MSPSITEIDAHEQPSEQLRARWKSYKTDPRNMQDHPDIDDPRSESEAGKYCVAGTIPKDRLLEAFSHVHPSIIDPSSIKDVPILYHPLLPGLLIVPDVVPPPVQKSLLSLMIHRDLINPHHQTNMHLNYEIPYREGTSDPDADPSFFSHSAKTAEHVFHPKDPSVHKPLTMKQVLDRRLSWVTLGGQYDWTNRIYPGTEPPSFPRDIGAFLEAIFPETQAQAAIVNFYTPGDTMMMHRDVSEETDKGLVSLSIGCEGLFMIAPNNSVSESKTTENDDAAGGNGGGGGDKGYLLLKLRSGDAIYMTQESRFAWHGVPKVLKGTCPSWLEDWPAEGNEEGAGGKYEEWRGWMKNKRINLNVRQMRD